jgi:hypothetical protein
MQGSAVEAPDVTARSAAVGAIVALAVLFATPGLALAKGGTAGIEAVAVQPGHVDTFAQDATVAVRVRATSRTGIDSIEVEFENRHRETPIPLAIEDFDLQRGTIHDGVWRDELVVPRYSEHGRWRLSFVRLAEGPGAPTDYFARDLRRLDLAASFLQTGPGDGSAPTLDDFEITPTEYDADVHPSQLTVDLLAHDDLSGMDMVGFTLHGPARLGGWGWFYDPTQTQRSFTVPAALSPPPVPGTYTVSVRLRDHTGNAWTYGSEELARRGWTSELVWR